MDEKSPKAINSLAEIRGFLDIFLPGLFLLLHFIPFVYCANSGQAILHDFGEHPAKAALFIMPAAYVLGLGLRLAGTRRADRISGWLCLRFAGKEMVTSAQNWLAESGPNGNWKKELRTETFPYPLLIKSRAASRLPPQASEFYKNTWCLQTKDYESGSGAFYFNFLKAIVCSIDERAEREIYNAEIMVRHIAYICYALFCSVSCCFAFWFFTMVKDPECFHGYRALLLYVVIIEMVVLLMVLLHLRLLRVEEVELVFAHCFINRAKLVEVLSEPMMSGAKAASAAASVS